MPRLDFLLQGALETESSPHVTVVRSGGLGDTLLTLPVLPVLAALPARPSLTFVGPRWAQELWPLLALPCRLLRFDGPAFTPLFTPWATNDPTGALAGAAAVVAFAASEDSALIDNIRRLCPGRVFTRSVHPPPGVHAALHFLRAVCDEAPHPPPLPPLRPAPDRLEWARRWIAARFGHRRAPLAVHPGSGGHRKCWPAGHFAAVAAALQRPAILLEGPADEEAVAGTGAGLGCDVPAAVAAGLALPDVAALLCCCHALVGNDSGVSHLAGMLGVRTIAVFGPTDPAVWGPLGPNARTVGGRGAWPEPAEVVALLRRASD